MDYFSSVISSCKTAGFTEAEFTNSYFNVLFTHPNSKIDLNSLNKYQKVSQFPSANELSRNDLHW